MANNVAYGFMTLEDVFDRRVATLDVPTITEAVELSLEVYNREWNGVASLLLDITTTAKESYQVPGAGTLQPLSEQGVPVPTKQFKKYDVAYPIQRGGDAWGTTREARAKMTVAELNANVMNVMRKDYDWLIRHAFAALLDNVSWTYQDDNDQIGSLTIKPLANNDTDTYPAHTENGVEAAADNHYLADADAWNDANPHHETILAELDEHPGNAGPYVLYIPQDQVSAAKALADYSEPQLSNVRYGDDQRLAADLPDGLLALGDKYIGTVGEFYVVRSRRLPAGYVVGIAAGGGKPLAMRQHPEPELQGLTSVVHQVNSNFEKVDYYRYGGFGARNRVAAVVMRIGNGSYAVPAAYNAPLAV